MSLTSSDGNYCRSDPFGWPRCAVVVVVVVVHVITLAFITLVRSARRRFSATTPNDLAELENTGRCRVEDCRTELWLLSFRFSSVVVRRRNRCRAVEFFFRTHFVYDPSREIPAKHTVAQNPSACRQIIHRSTVTVHLLISIVSRFDFLRVLERRVRRASFRWKSSTIISLRPRRVTRSDRQGSDFEAM